jgi:N-acetylmuramoyl-L-alanine amidase
MRDIKYIIIHCSDSPDDRDVDVNEIRKWHVENNKWKDVGYHYVIKRDGEVQSGRPEEEVGAHCKGYNNNSIGVCLVGRRSFDPRQFWSLKALCFDLRVKYPQASIKGHRDFTDQKTCPNFEVRAILEDIEC